MGLNHFERIEVERLAKTELDLGGAVLYKSNNLIYKNSTFKNLYLYICFNTIETTRGCYKKHSIFKRFLSGILF